MWYNIKAFELPSVLPTRVNATPLNERHDIKAGSPLAQGANECLKNKEEVSNGCFETHCCGLYEIRSAQL